MGSPRDVKNGTMLSSFVSTFAYTWFRQALARTLIAEIE
jgi:hypothetical protein